jgi:quercetin dioxygenase-like cupin family protein
MSETTGHEYLKSHAISGDALLLDLDQESSAILDAAKAAAVGHAAKTLVKDGSLRLLLLGFKAGAALHEHDAAGPVSLHVLSGHVDITSPGQSDSLTAGAAIVFNASIRHSVEAKTDSVVLATIALPA